ncbi:MAG: hypothetical protein WBQ95_10030, partial [Terracidiphilus sp.]
AIGIVLGIPASYEALRAVKAGLLGVDPADLLTILAALVMSAALLIGSNIPARLATKIDPIVALRYE